MATTRTMLVLDIVSKVLIYRNIEISTCRNVEVSMYRNIEVSIYRNIEVSIYGNIERVLPSVLWHPRVFHADIKRKLRCICQISISYV